MTNQIDSLSEIDLKNVTAEELRWKYGSFHAISKGTGRNKVTSDRSGVYTPIGDIEISVWVEAAKSVIHRDGLDEELEHMTEFYHKKKIPAFTKDELYQQSLDAVLSALYKDPAWGGFIEYNEKYHPDLLAAAKLVEVYTDCCGVPCTFMEARLERGDNHVVCPQCGTWSKTHRDKNGADIEEEDML